MKHDRKQSNYFKNRQVEESSVYLVFPIDIVPQSNQIVDIGKFLLLHRSNPNISHKKIELCHSAIPKYNWPMQWSAMATTITRKDTLYKCPVPSMKYSCQKKRGRQAGGKERSSSQFRENLRWGDLLKK